MDEPRRIDTPTGTVTCGDSMQGGTVFPVDKAGRTTKAVALFGDEVRIVLVECSYGR